MHRCEDCSANSTLSKAKSGDSYRNKTSRRQVLMMAQRIGVLASDYVQEC
jgi:hypothetical protein